MQISMVDATLFETLEAVARHVRRSKAPFGGIQLILSGVAQQLYLCPVSPDVFIQSSQARKSTRTTYILCRPCMEAAPFPSQRTRTWY